MGLGGTAKKIQTLADTAEKMYQRLNDLREQVQATQESVTDTTDRVKRLENEMAEQRALLNAVAIELDVDVEKVSAEAHITDAEAADGDDAGEETTDDDQGDADRDDHQGDADRDDHQGDADRDDQGDADRDDQGDADRDDHQGDRETESNPKNNTD